MYELRTTDGAKIMITKEERDAILQSKQAGQSHIYLQRTDDTIMTNAITGMYTPAAHDQQEGYLHDGTKVIKKFGQWVDARNPEVRLSASHYPEIMQDRVMTLEQYQERSQTPQLPHTEPLAIEDRGQGGMEGIGETMDRHELDTH